MVNSSDPFSIFFSISSISPTVTERGNGWYNLALTTSHSDTVGDLAIHATGTGADPTDLLVQVRSNVLGDTLPVNVTQISSDSTAADNAERYFDGSGYGPLVYHAEISTVASQTSWTLPVGAPSENDMLNGCRVVVFSEGLPDDRAMGIVADYVGSTRTVTFDPTGNGHQISPGDPVSFIATGFTEEDRALVDTEVAAIKAKTDGLTFTVANKVDANTTHWLGNVVDTPSQPGVPEVDITHVLGSPVCD